MQMVFNAANDAAVALFSAGAIGFWQISQIIEQALQSFSAAALHSFEEIYALDGEIRSFAQQVAQQFV